jgi:hypothetical protein
MGPYSYAHLGGLPLRVEVHGVGEVEGKTVGRRLSSHPVLVTTVTVDTTNAKGEVVAGDVRKRASMAGGAVDLEAQTVSLLDREGFPCAPWTSLRVVAVMADGSEHDLS